MGLLELQPRSRTREGAPRGRIGGLVLMLVEELFVLLGMIPPGGAEYAGGTDCGEGGDWRVWLRDRAVCFESLLCVGAV